MVNRARPIVALLLITAAARVGGATPLSVVQSVHVGGPGRWDYIAIDPTTHDLYVTRTTHEQVIDPSTGRVVADIAGGQELHGTAVVPSVGRAFVTDGKEGTIRVIDTKTFAPLGTIAAAEDADGVIYDGGTDRVLVSCGDAGVLAVLDPHAEVATAAVRKIDLDGKPEFLAADGKGRAFVCLEDKSLIAVVDLNAGKVVARWPLGTGTSPAGLAIDVKNGRLFAGCRNEKAVVASTADGRVLAEVPIGKGNDACTFDPVTGHAFASCADGTVTVIGDSPSGIPGALQTIQTRPGARTCAVDPATQTLYLPAAEMLPAVDGKRAKFKPDTFMIVVVHAAE